MVVKCCIKGCKSEQYPGSEMTFHGFPSDEKLKSKWIDTTKVTGNVKYKRVCQLHFKDEDFVTKSAVVRLKRNVIPRFCSAPFRTYSEVKMLNKPSNVDYITTKNYEKLVECKNTDILEDLSDADNLEDSNGILCTDAPTGFKQKDKMSGDMARCKCCLESNRLKGMWREHYSGGVYEVYGIMLTECFALHWNRPKNMENSPDLICESCIARLRDAVSYKAEVLASEQLLNGQLEAEAVDKLKQERYDLESNIESEYLQYDEFDNNVASNEEVVDASDDNDLIDDVNDDGEKYIENDKEMSIKSELPLNDTQTASKKKESSNRQIITAIKNRKRKQTTITAPKKFKMSRKAISNALKNKDNLISPIREIQNNKEIAQFGSRTAKSMKNVECKGLTDTMAYYVPQELIANEINNVPKICGKEENNDTKYNIKNGVVFIEMQRIIDDEIHSEKAIGNDKLSRKKTGSKVKEKSLRKNVEKPTENRLAEMKKQANNIAIILEHTNATPIRRHGGIGYGCCFCNEEFPDATDLKQHTIQKHDVKTKRNYAKGKRPSAYLVKLDITDLKCNLCGDTIDSLEQLYDHLIEVHKKLLYKNAKNYIVPFKFNQDELRCLFCEFICNSFKGLLEHMSMHYRNHICEICDAGFLTKNNLFNHTGRHKKGTFKCDYCPKVFDTSSKKAGHQRLVHSNTNGVNRCGYCGEMFGTYRRKEKHLITEHGVTLKKLKCKACDKTFETQTALRIHTKRDHLIERRFKCSVCDKRCFTNVQLSQHTLKHTGVKKFQCTICLKAYGRKSTLREHMRIHENDRRFKCEICDMAFVQKCSWRGHMLSKHGQQI